MLRLYLCDYSDAEVVVKRGISVAGTNNVNRKNKKLTFKKNAHSRSRILIIDNTFINNRA